MPLWKGKKVSNRRFKELKSGAEKRIIGNHTWYNSLFKDEYRTIGGNKQTHLFDVAPYRGKGSL